MGHGEGKGGGRMRRAHGQYKHRQSHVLVHKTNTDTQNKDNQDRTLAFIRGLDPTYKTTAIILKSAYKCVQSFSLLFRLIQNFVIDIFPDISVLCQKWLFLIFHTRTDFEIL